MTHRFSIWYPSGYRVDGETAADWLAAPTYGVQVVAEWRSPTLAERRWSGVFDRVLWTGTDTFDPFGWGVKVGAQLSDADYFRIWREAAHGMRPLQWR